MTALLDWWWQGSLLTALAALALRPAGWHAAATRHLLWWVVLAGVLLLPAWRVLAVASPVDRESAGHAATLVVPSSPAPWLALVGLVWTALTLTLAVRIARGLAAAARLRRESAPFDPARAARLPLWRARPAGGRAVVLRVSDRAWMPCAVGLGAPTVILPRDLVDRLTDEQLDEIVLHECAHLARYDDWWQFAQALVTALVPLHPAVHWIGRHAALEREAACDDVVVAQTAAPRRYAQCLVDVASEVGRRRRGTHVPGLVPAATRAGRALHARVRRLLDAGYRPARRSEPALVAAGALTMSLGVVSLVATEPLVVFREMLVTRPVVGGRPLAAAEALRPPGPVVDVVLTSGPPSSRAASSPQTAEGRAARRVESDAPQGATLTAIDRTVDAPEAPPLAARAVAATAALPSAPRPAAPVEAISVTSPWRRLADAGTALGDGSARGGAAIGRSFLEAGRAVAGAFRGARQEP